MNQIDWAYLAGLLDGDGTLTISMTLSRTKNPSILFTFQMKIALKENDGNYLIELQQKFLRGRIYFSNKGEPHGVCSWQTTNLSDTLFLVSGILPYLKIKKHKARIFFDAANYWNQTSINITGTRQSGKHLRTKEQITKLLKIALNLNFDRQTMRYRDRKGWKYWKKIIDKFY